MKAEGGRLRCMMRMMWSAFLVAIPAEGLFFSLFDPHELQWFGDPLVVSRQAIYTLGFFGFWLVGIAASALTLFLSCTPPAPAPAPESQNR